MLYTVYNIQCVTSNIIKNIIMPVLQEFDSFSPFFTWPSLSHTKKLHCSIPIPTMQSSHAKFPARTSGRDWHTFRKQRGNSVATTWQQRDSPKAEKSARILSKYEEMIGNAYSEYMWVLLLAHSAWLQIDIHMSLWTVKVYVWLSLAAVRNFGLFTTFAVYSQVPLSNCPC